MRAKELFEFINQHQMKEVESFCDALWGRLGIEVEFTRHFFDRVNDGRNGKPITVAELIRLFRKEYEQHGKKVRDMDANDEAVFADLVTNVNLPFVVAGNTDDKTVIAKTVMRKPDFKSPDPLLKVK